MILKGGVAPLRVLLLLFAQAKRRPCPGRGESKTRFQPVPPRSGGKEKASAARRAADCYGYITTTPIPLTNENPRDKLPTVNLETPCPTVLPGTDTGPASHGMCSGANRRVVTSGAYKIEVRGLIMAVWLEKTATNRSFSGLSTSKN